MARKKRTGCAPKRPEELRDYTSPSGWGTPEVALEVGRLAEEIGGRMGMTRRQFLKTQMGMAATFLAMNSVLGTFFAVDTAEAAEKGAAAEASARLEEQFIFDVQVHYLHEDFPSPDGLLSLRRVADRWNGGGMEEHTHQDLLFENFYREVFEQSQTSMAVLSNAPADDRRGWFLTNERALATREKVNRRRGRRSLLAHGLIIPGQPGWLEEFEKTLEMKPDAWKGYTLGDPGGGSQYQWRLDDEKLMYPVYERMKRAGVTTVCIHKGLLPTGYAGWMDEDKVAHATVDDVGRAARDWPELDFVIYHSAIEKVIPTATDAEAFARTGRIDWVTDLAEIPEKYGVNNVYGEIGAAFADTCVAHPRLCAGMLGTLIRGLGADRVCWGTDSVWFGSPQWQIEAFRRLEIPEDMQREHGFQPLGPADGEVKRAILGANSARLYGIDPGA
ncbi:amidohydrolase family protein [Desulfohalovibrio reitneri]|uniref:amidohydrolase family protein n=1 Tax=Desulfohalovibrio reitneri TaxID=1307759 RepID=UPI00068E24D7|nr:amidohydrolase family protein [Desulfohalovibrio reitneri]